MDDRWLADVGEGDKSEIGSWEVGQVFNLSVLFTDRLETCPTVGEGDKSEIGSWEVGQVFNLSVLFTDRLETQCRLVKEIHSLL
jgi:K+-transporting ATPase c subunit